MDQITNASAAMALAIEIPKIIITGEWLDMQEENIAFMVEDEEF